MKNSGRKIIIVMTMLFGTVVYANVIQPTTTNVDCQQIQMQCKNNEISASDCMQKIEMCMQQTAQDREQQMAPEKMNDSNAVQTPQHHNNIMSDGQPEAPVDDGKTGTATPTTNPHPDWHFGNKLISDQ